ncbi:MAG: S9 family peptidase [Anaerolineales bacterium]|nr:S9 family peptidase [Anaerolineales bacterium]
MPEPQSSSTSYLPSLRDMLALEVPLETRVSPAGGRVAISARRADWNEDRYETQCLIYDQGRGRVFPLTRTGSVSQVEWVDEETLALLKTPGGNGDAPQDKPQIWLYEGLVGEGWRVTDHKTGVEAFKPFAGGFLYLASNPERDEKKARQEKFGNFVHFEQEDSASALYYTGLDEARNYLSQMRAATEDESKALTPPVVELSKLFEQPLRIVGMVPSPRGDAVYLNCRQRDDLVYFRQGSVYCLQLDAGAALAEYLARQKARKEAEKVSGDSKPATPETPEKEDYSYLGRLTRLNLPARAQVAAVSPDGSQLLIEYQGRDDKMYTRSDLWVIDVPAALAASDEAAFLAGMHNISASLDQLVLTVYWVESGIFGLYYDGTVVRLARFHGDGQYTVLELLGPDEQSLWPWYDFHISAAGSIGLVAANASSFPEACLARPDGSGRPWRVQRLTDYGQALAGWLMGTVETIRWKSKDGVEIEGVLRKPVDFDQAKKYPLVFVVHGGPTDSSHSYLISGEDLRYYPSVQFANQGFLVLKPNYRGSMGRGQAFMELNVNNLGVGDLWDLESAVDYLAGLGWVDPERVGCMGWSQGGYISAFAGLRSKKFRAVSVGAGVSDWYTYHISNDIPDFTVDYLSGSPFSRREEYIKTAPISGLPEASTPMLIQHGSDDRRVPLSNATELYRGLKEMGLPVELFIFPGMGHPITKPRENHAVMHQNLSWFSHYLLGEPLDLIPT